MAGGPWDLMDLPDLAGLYANFIAAALATIQTGDRGVVVLPVKAHWGAVREFVTITGENDLLNKYAASSDSNGSTAYKALRLTLLGGAKTILAYRLASPSAAPSSVILQNTDSTNMMTINALYPGERGNNFKITVQTNILDSSKQDLKLYEGATLLKTFSFISGDIDAAVTTINTDTTNIWIRATAIPSASGTLSTISSVSMSGGNSGIDDISAADYTSAMNAFETQTFNMLALDGITDAAIQTSTRAWVVRMRSQGKCIECCMGGTHADDTAQDAVKKAIARTAGFNHEGIINVGTGAVLDDVVYSSADVACYVAGLIAGQKLTESTTYATTPFDDVTRRWTHTEQKEAVRNGVFILFHDGRIVKPLRGMNSLITLRQGQNNSFKKIRAIRVMDAFNTDLQKAAEDNYIGKINNTAEGRLALIAAFKQYMETMAKAGVIESTGWDAYLDPTYVYSANDAADGKIVAEPDQVFPIWTARITDVIEQIFGTFIVQ